MELKAKNLKYGIIVYNYNAVRLGIGRRKKGYVPARNVMSPHPLHARKNIEE